MKKFLLVCRISAHWLQTRFSFLNKCLLFFSEFPHYTVSSEARKREIYNQHIFEIQKKWHQNILSAISFVICNLSCESKSRLTDLKKIMFEIKMFQISAPCPQPFKRTPKTFFFLLFHRKAKTILFFELKIQTLWPQNKLIMTFSP